MSAGTLLVPDRRPRALEGARERAIDVTPLARSVKSPRRLGLLIICVFVVGFGAWAALVPLAGGAVASGVISPDGSKKTVQHLEGGIIRKLHVRDGDVVKAGQPLLLLETVQPRAAHDMLLTQRRTLHITRARLDAEKANRDELVFPPELLSKQPEVQAILQGQRDVFHTRRTSHLARKRVLKQRIEQLKEQIKGFQAQVASTSRQLALIAEEVKGKEELERKGYLPRPELWRMERMEAEIHGKRGEYIAAISRAEQQIGEAEIQLLTLDADRADQIANQLDQIRNELATVEERLLASEDILNRTVVAAPVSGTVVNLKFKTESGVVQRGEPILDIVPSDDVLLIDARVSPIDIDVVHVGLSAQVQLLAFSSRSTPRVKGVVRSVSADRLVDEHTRQPYYLARVEVDREELKRIAPQVELVSGMPADVLIVTGEQTMVQYLFRPFLDALWRSLRET